MYFKHLRIIGIGFAICLVVAVIVLMFKIKKYPNEALDSFNDDLPNTSEWTANDSVLISEKYRSRFKIVEVINSKKRGPIWDLEFDSLYGMTNYKIELIDDVQLTSILDTESESVHQSNGYTYSILNEGYYGFKYRTGPVKPASHIYLTLSGDSITTVKSNDTILSYHLICNNLSIRYGKDEPIDIFVEGNHKGWGMSHNLPMDVLFLKRNKSLYFSMMTGANPDATISADLLYNIVTGN